MNYFCIPLIGEVGEGVVAFAEWGEVVRVVIFGDGEALRVVNADC